MCPIKDHTDLSKAAAVSSYLENQIKIFKKYRLQAIQAIQARHINFIIIINFLRKICKVYYKSKRVPKTAANVKYRKSYTGKNVKEKILADTYTNKNPSINLLKVCSTNIYLT